MEQRNLAQRKAAASGDQEDWRLFQALRNQCVASQRMDRQNWEKRKLSSSENSPSTLWKSVKGIIRWSNTGPPTRLFHMGKYISSPAGLATTLNNFVFNKVKNLRQSIPGAKMDPLSKLCETMNNRQCTFETQLVTEQEVMKIIESLNSSLSTGVDFIDSQTIKLVKNEILCAVRKIINLSMETSTFPSIYKLLQVIPLKKNPAYGRHRISRPMRIVAPIPQ